MDKVCLVCGSKGFTNAFVHCVKCLEFAVHRYCLAVIPETFDEFVPWFCDDCEVKEQNLSAANRHGAVLSGTRDDTSLEDIEEISGAEEKQNDTVSIRPKLQDSDCRRKQFYDDCAELDLVERGESATECSRMEHKDVNNKTAVEQFPAPTLEEEKDEDILTLSDRLKNIKNNVKKKRSALIKSSMEECRRYEKSDTRNGKLECLVLSCNGWSKKKRFVVSSEANVKDRRHEIGSSQHEENKKLGIENQYSDRCTGGRGTRSSNKHKEEESVNDVIQNAELCNSKENLKKRSGVAESLVEKDHCRSRNGEHLILSCNGSLRNPDKKRHVVSSEADVDGQGHRAGISLTYEEKRNHANSEDQCSDIPDEERNGQTGKGVDYYQASFAQTCDENKNPGDSENQCCDANDEERNIATSSGKNEVDYLIEVRDLSSGEENMKKDSMVTESSVYKVHCRSDIENGTEDNPILSSLKVSNKRFVMVREAEVEEQRQKSGHAQLCQESKELDLEKQSVDVSKEENIIITNNGHVVEKHCCGSGNGLDTVNDREDDPTLSSLKSSKRKRVVLALKADVEEQRYEAVSDRACQKNKEPKLENQSLDVRTERKGRGPINKEEEKALANLKQHSKLSNVKENMKRRSVNAKFSVEKDQRRHGNGSDSPHDKTEHPLQPCNGRIVALSEVNDKEERLRAGSAQTCKENKELALKEQYDLGSEGKAIGPSNDHTGNRVSEAIQERSSLPDHNGNHCLEFPKDANISSIPTVHPFAQPIITPIWRGTFNIWNREHNLLDGLRAHVSSLASDKVYEVAYQFPLVLKLEILPKTNVWPKTFQKSEPNAEKIGLYFFPDATSERIYECLVEEMVRNKLALRAFMQNAELLIFTSTELPVLYWRFQNKLYLWGVFRGKQNTPSNSHLCIQESGDKKIDSLCWYNKEP